MPCVCRKKYKSVVGVSDIKIYMSYVAAVTFIIMRPDGKILMQQRDDGQGKEIPYPNMWTFPGGEKEEQESHIEAVIREIKEEYDLDISTDQCGLILSYDHDKNLGDQIFVCRVTQDTNPKLLEGRAMQWMSLEKIKKLSLAWQLNKVLQQIEEKTDAIMQKWKEVKKYKKGCSK